MEWFLHNRNLRHERIKFNFVNSDMGLDFQLRKIFNYAEA